MVQTLTVSYNRTQRTKQMRIKAPQIKCTFSKRHAQLNLVNTSVFVKKNILYLSQARVTLLPLILWCQHAIKCTIKPPKPSHLNHPPYLVRRMEVAKINNKYINYFINSKSKYRLLNALRILKNKFRHKLLICDINRHFCFNLPLYLITFVFISPYTFTFLSNFPLHIYYYFFNN